MAHSQLAVVARNGTTRFEDSEDAPLFVTRHKRWSSIHGFPSPLQSGEPGWEAVAVELFRIDAPVQTPAIALEDYCVAIVRSGRVKAWIEDRHHWANLVAGHVGIIPPGLAHGARTWPWAELTVIYLAPSLVTHAADQVNRQRASLAPRLAVRDCQVESIAAALEEELRSGLLGGRLFGESLGLALAAHMLGHYDVEQIRSREYRGGMPMHLLRRTLDYIDANLSDDLGLSELAANVGMSQYHFCRMFKQVTGLPPHQYVMRERIEHSKRLLAVGEMGLAQIASDSHFSDQAHFATVFRRFTGMTPKQYVNRR